MTQKEVSDLFTDLIGQSPAKALLKAALLKNHIAPAYLFAGPEGVGRGLAAFRFLEGITNNGTPCARQRRRLQTLNHPDLLWIEPSYNHTGNLIPKSQAEKEGISKRVPPQIRLEQIRELKRFLSRQTVETKLAMVVIEDIETMREAASNALLKTLEEPGKAILILIASRTEKLLPTILSRCQTIPFIGLQDNELLQVILENQITKEAIAKPELNQKELIAISNGSPGQLIANIKMWEEIPRELWKDLRDLPKEPMQSLSLARDVTEALDGEQQLWLISWLQQHLWVKTNNPNQIKLLEHLRNQLTCYVQPRLAWEVTLLELQN